MRMKSICLNYLVVLAISLFCVPLCHSASYEEIRPLWPPPDNRAWLEFIGIYRSHKDLLPTDIDISLESIVGIEGFRRDLNKPVSLASFDDNTVLVIERGRDNIVAFDFEKGETRALFENLFPLFYNPVDIVVDKEQNIYVADQAKSLISVFNKDFSPSHTIGGKIGFKRMEKMAVDSQANALYVSDSVLNKVFAFNTEGNLLFEIGSGDAPPDSRLKSPHGITVDRDNGDIYVADTGNAQIKIYDKSGQFLKILELKSPEASPLKVPWDVAFDSLGYLHIIDQRLAAIITFTKEGKLLFSTMARFRTNHMMGFNRPTDIHIDANDQVFVTDLLNNRISLWQRLTEPYLEKHPITQADIEAIKAFITQSKEKKKREEKTRVLASSKSRKTGAVTVATSDTEEKKYRKVTCPNCKKQYYLQFIGTDKDNSFY